MPNRSFIAVLVPIFLIISSSIYPAFMPGIENREKLIISKVMAELEKDNVVESRYKAHMQMTSGSSSDITPSSPTPIDPTSLSTSTSTSTSTRESNDTSTPSPMQQQDEGDDKMTITTINPGDLLHTVWYDDTPGNFDIFYKRDGADYDPTTVNFSNDAGGSFNAAIAVSGNNVHIVWEDVTTFEILYRKSIDGGALFGPTINLSNNAGTSGLPAIAVSGNSVHVVWSDNTSGNFDILYKRSTDGGVSFIEPTKNLSSNAGNSFSPAIAVSGNNVHVVWRDSTPGNFDILYRRSLDGGTTFSNIIKNLSSNFNNSADPDIAVSGNSVHVVWSDETPGNFDILYRRSLDNGSTFPNIIKNLSGNTGSSDSPSIAASGNNLHVVWSDSTPGNFDILYRRSLDNGSTFPNIIKNLSSNFGFSADPDIAVSGNNVYVVWNDNAPGDFEIVYRTSADNGASFPAVSTNLSGNAGESRVPAIAVS